MMAFGSCQRCQTVCSGFAIYKGKPAAIQRQPISCDAVAHQCSLFIIEFIAVPWASVTIIIEFKFWIKTMRRTDAAKWCRLERLFATTFTSPSCLHTLFRETGSKVRAAFLEAGTRPWQSSGKLLTRGKRPDSPEELGSPPASFRFSHSDGLALANLRLVLPMQSLDIVHADLGPPVLVDMKHCTAIIVRRTRTRTGACNKAYC